MNSAFQPMSFQESVFRELKEMARDFFDYDWRHLPIYPRQNPLVVGSTGTGKSLLLECLGRDMGLPIICLEFSGWIDEVEKLGGSDVESDWGKAVQLELFSVLDKRILAGVTDADDDQPRAVPFSIRASHLERKFKASFFVVGAGAWQGIWDKGTDIGFGADENERPVKLSYPQLGNMLRPEIRNRFNSSVLWLPPLTLYDYQMLLREAVDRLPAEFTAIMIKKAAETMLEAAETKKGFRWIQELIVAAVRELRTNRKQTLYPAATT